MSKLNKMVLDTDNLIYNLQLVIFLFKYLRRINRLPLVETYTSMKTVFRGTGSNLTQRAKGIGDSGAARPLIQLERSPREALQCQPPSHSPTLTSTRTCGYIIRFYFLLLT